MVRIVSLLLVLLMVAACEARGRRGSCGPNGCGYQAYTAPQAYTTPAPSVPVIVAPDQIGHTELHNRDAQGVANMMAARNYVGHFGGNPGYEGCGMASTKAGAYAICCYANSGMQTVDVGYAQGRNGMWFCCRRYK